MKRSVPLETLHRELLKDTAYRVAYAEEDLVHRVALRIYLLRTKMGWSQEKLAERAQVRQSYISEIESGDRNITLRVLARIAHAFGRDPDEFIKRDYHIVPLLKKTGRRRAKATA